jgi:hypothetical protein
MPYCPNCSAYQYDAAAETCSKCGHVLHISTAPEEKSDLDEFAPKMVEEPSYSVRQPCKRCGAPTKVTNGEIEIEVEGERLSINGLKLMGGEITKKAVTRYTYHVQGYTCKEEHRFYSDFRCRIRPLCPVCYDPMIKYGSSLFSCTRCNKHFSLESWVEPDAEEVLLDHGWAPVPE